MAISDGSVASDQLGGLRIDLGQHVGVDIQGEGHGGMSEASRDNRRIDIFGQGQAGVGVAQTVQWSRRQRRGAHQANEQGADTLGLQLGAVLDGEDSTVRPAGERPALAPPPSRHPVR